MFQCVGGVLLWPISAVFSAASSATSLFVDCVHDAHRDRPISRVGCSVGRCPGGGPYPWTHQTSLKVTQLTQRATAGAGSARRGPQPHRALRRVGCGGLRLGALGRLSQRNRHHNVVPTSDRPAIPRDLNSIDVQLVDLSKGCRADAYCARMLLSSMSIPPGATRLLSQTRRRQADRALPSTLTKSKDSRSRRTPT